MGSSDKRYIAIPSQSCRYLTAGNVYSFERSLNDDLARLIDDEGFWIRNSEDDEYLDLFFLNSEVCSQFVKKVE